MEKTLKYALLFVMLLVPVSALAECKARTPEPFEKFLESFGSSKSFALTRTEYPLTFIKHEDLDPAQEGRTAVKKLIQKRDDATVPAIAVFARDNDVELSTTALKSAEATVRMAKPGTDSLIVDYHFVRKGTCWYLRRMEDHTL